MEQALIDRFAECTGDHQWIHVDPDRARRESSFGTTIAHGFLTLSLVPRFTWELGILPADARQALNYGTERIRFLAPVRAGARIRGRVVLLGVGDRGHGRVLMRAEHKVEIEGEDRPAMVAEILIMLLPPEQEA